MFAGSSSDSPSDGGAAGTADADLPAMDAGRWMSTVRAAGLLVDGAVAPEVGRTIGPMVCTFTSIGCTVAADGVHFHVDWVHCRARWVHEPRLPLGWLSRADGRTLTVYRGECLLASPGFARFDA